MKLGKISLSRDSVIAAALFFIALFVYLRTLCPTLYWGDCGELATAAYTLGVAHPTGYPLWCLIGKLWTLMLPFGSVVWRLNTMSAVFGAAAIPCLYGFSRLTGAPRSISAAAAALFAFSLTFWQQCLFCETYSMTAFYTSLLLFLAARWRVRGRTGSDLKILAVAYGFAITNHQTNTLFLPGFLAFIFLSQPALISLKDPAVRRQWASTLILGAAPLLFYAYIPIRALAQPAANWGNPVTPFSFWYHVTGRGYSDAMFHSAPSIVWGKLAVWAVALGNELPWFLVACAALGLIFLLADRAQRPFGALLGWILLADIVYTVNYNIYNAYIYFIPAYIAISMLAPTGLIRLWRRAEAAIEPAKRTRFALLAASCLLAAAPFQLLRHWRQNDLSHNWTCYDYGRNILATVPAGGVLIDNGKDTSAFAVCYLQNVEGYRNDVVLVKRGVLAGLYDPSYDRWVFYWYLNELTRKDPAFARWFPGGVFSVSKMGSLTEEPLKRIIRDSLIENRPIFVLNPDSYPPMHDTAATRVSIQSYLDKNDATAQIGLLTEVFPKGKRPPDSVVLARTREVWSRYSLRGVYDGIYTGDDYLTGIALDYANAELAYGRVAFVNGDLDESQTAFGHVLRLFQSREAVDTLQRIADLREKRAKVAALPSNGNRVVLSNGNPLLLRISTGRENGIISDKTPSRKVIP